MKDRVSAEQYIERLRFRRAPLAAAAVWFALGVLLARWHAHETIHVVGALALCSLIALASLRARVGWVPVAAVWIALGVAASEWQPAPSKQSGLLAYADNLSRTVRGRVMRVQVPPPQAESHDLDQTPPWEASEDTSQQHGQSVTLDVAVDEVEEVTPETSRMVPAPGGIRVSVFQAEASEGFHCGDRLESEMRLKPPERFRTPGAFDYGNYLLTQKGIAARANVSAAKIRRLGGSPPSLQCRLFGAQTWAAERLLAYTGSALNARLAPFLQLTQADSLMLNAMLFGDRAGLTHALRTGFERTGTFHLFVVSGLHVALVAAGLYWLLVRLRAPVWLATALTLAGSTGYAALTGFGQPSQRALAMTAVFLIARLMNRGRDSLNALGAAILMMLVVAPSSLFEASFQMTVLVIVAIAGVAIPLARRTPIRHAEMTRLIFVRPRKIFAPRSAQLLLMLEVWGEALAGVFPLRWTERTRRLPALLFAAFLRVMELALISVVAEFLMLLPMAFYFHRLPVFAVPANVLVLPLIGILVPCAFATFAVSLLSVKLALVPGVVTAMLLHLITFAIHHLSGLHSSDQRIRGPGSWVILVAVLCWAGCCWLVRRSGLAAAAVVVVLPLVAACIVWPERPVTTPGALEITAIDVGQGDSILAINPEGAAMLIDAGGPVGSHGAAEIVSSFDVGEQVVAPYLWSRRMRRLDILVLTHAHTDHMGGMPAVLADLRPRELWVGVDPASPLYTALLIEAAGLGIPVRHVRAGDHQSWGSVAIDVFAPVPGYSNASAPRNDDSVVLHLQYGRASVLLEGDAERPSEDAMIAAKRIEPVTLLKVGHHGSKTSSNPEFLAVAKPLEAVISVGRGNPFGHPRAEVIERFADAHTRLYRTDTQGLTTFLLTPDGAIRSSGP